MISISEAAQAHFVKLLQNQEDNTNIRVFVVNPGTPSAECGVSYCTPDAVEPNDVRLPFNGFDAVVDPESAPFLEEAEIDYVTDGTKTYAISGGHEMMTKVTATGCALSCLIGAAIAVGEDKLLSTSAIIGIYGLAGKMASEEAKGPGSLRVHLLDNLANLTPADVSENVKIENA